MHPNKKDITKWCKALRSGKYKQTKDTLQDKKGYCRLGVSCDIFIPDELKSLNKDRSLFGDLSNSQKAPGWLKDINHDFSIKTTYSLSRLNDSEDFTFDEIADVLEAVYIHEVLG